MDPSGAIKIGRESRICSWYQKRCHPRHTYIPQVKRGAWLSAGQIDECLIPDMPPRLRVYPLISPPQHHNVAPELLVSSVYSQWTVDAAAINTTPDKVHVAVPL